jgi:hypothetical protein
MLLLLAAGGAACGMRAVVWVRGVRGVRAVYDGWCNFGDSRSCCGAADEGSGPRFAPYSARWQACGWRWEVERKTQAAAKECE